MGVCATTLTLAPGASQVVVESPTTTLLPDGPDALVLVVNTPSVVVPVDIQTQVIEVFQGGGDPAPARYPLFEFDFATPTPVVVTALVASDLILSSEVEVTTPFDDSSATLQLGVAGDPGMIFSSLETELSLEATFHSGLNHAAVGDVILQLSPGASTQGSGKIILHIRRSL